MGFLDQQEMGVGTWAWGKGIVWGFHKGYEAGDLHGTFEAARDSGLTFFDTAEVYGDGESESFLGSFIRERPFPGLKVASKFAPLPWRFRVRDMLRSLKKSLGRLGLPSLDLYQMHWPSPPRSIRAWMEPLAIAVKEGLAKEVGVSNFSRDQMLRAQEALGRFGVPLSSNQMQYSLVRRKNEFNGLLEECRRARIRFIAYSPLGMGMLSGKYGPSTPPQGPRRLFYFGQLAKVQALVDRLRRIGEAQGGKTPNQVALNWLLGKGALPIPGAKTRAQLTENAGALGWRLTASQMEDLDQASKDFRL